MINIRSDEDASPEDVLDAMTPEQAAQVPFLQHPLQLCERTGPYRCAL